MVQALPKSSTANHEGSGADGTNRQSLDDLIDAVDKLIFEVSQGDITKYEEVSDQPGDLFFKWLGWQRERDRQEKEFQAALRGVKLQAGMQTRELEAASGQSLASIASNFRGRMDFQRVKVSKEEKARRKRELEERKKNGNGF